MHYAAARPSDPVTIGYLVYKPIYGHEYIAHNSVIFCPIPKMFIYGCTGDDNLSDCR